MASLTFDNLCQALSMSFSPDKTTRNSAEAALASIKGVSEGRACEGRVFQSYNGSYNTLT